MNNNKNISMFKWGINFIIPILCFLIPTTETFTPQIRSFFVITLFCIILIATENLPVFTISLMLPFMYLVFLKQDPSLVFKAWSLEVPWLILGGFILTIALKKSGLLKRLSYMIILLFGGTVRGILYGLLVIGIMTTLVVADATAKAVLMGTLVLGICDALEIKKGSRNATVLGLATFAAAMGPSFIFMVSTGFMTVSGILTAANYSVPTYLEYLLHMGAPQLLFCICTVVMIDILYKPEKLLRSKEFFKEELQKLGAFSSNEKKVLAISIGLVILLVSGSIHGILSGWVFMLVAIITMLPGINLVTPEDVKQVNFTFMMFVVGCLTIGVVSGPLGVGKFIADTVYPYITGSVNQLFAGVWSLGFLSNFILTPLAAYSTFTLPIAEMATQAGTNYLAVIYTFVSSLEQVIFPYEYAPVLLIYGYGLVSFKDFFKYHVIKVILNIAFISLIFIPFWNFIGLL
ncbi:hypothetical protein AN639_02340 [Candidatus Epulonipiscium fishelsonii]|uniref:Uncharacterized protein n=1 Tax=Candidatus Epulonipiscium fishelsonii TaxID=77094 RepID=A0ACC8X9H5_9FIRM|nr:hypothetical protein AN396_09835 [Epulopiscium sp. SCG-B11WGA-EpuloA1]ONI42282.1 hypothetical protein AN639_02340 [Epulopiscium sp. SCG-B05WGA-EpuloA1]